MLITGLDTETTGLSQVTGDKIIEIALLTYDSDSRSLVDKYVQRIDPQRAIDPKAQAVHHISYEELVGCPVWDDIAGEVSSRLSKSSLLIAHNMGFDGPFIAGELGRVGMAVPNVPSFCTMESGRWACFDGKLPKLMELCFALDVTYDPSAAHAADYDVMVMMECFWKARDRGFFNPVGLTGSPLLAPTLKAAA